MKIRRGNKYFKGGPNISMIFAPGVEGSKYFDIFGPGDQK